MNEAIENVLLHYSFPPAAESAIREGKFNVAIDVLVARHDYIPDSLLALADAEQQKTAPEGYRVRHERYQGHIRVVWCKTGRDYASED